MGSASCRPVQWKDVMWGHRRWPTARSRSRHHGRGRPIGQALSVFEAVRSAHTMKVLVAPQE